MHSAALMYDVGNVLLQSSNLVLVEGLQTQYGDCEVAVSKPQLMTQCSSKRTIQICNSQYTDYAYVSASSLCQNVRATAFKRIKQMGIFF